MGGGATIRAVAKMAGMGVVNSGIRGRLPEHPVSAATCAVSRPVAAIGATSSAADSVKSVVVEDMTTQKPLCEIDDWNFADYGEDIDADNKIMPRVVFGAVPTFEEANQATSELKQVLEKAYISSPVSPRFENTGQDSSFPSIENSDTLCLTTETAVPTYAVQAFKFLNESPAVQVVVASIASDPNVWDSVLQNPALQDYLRTQKIDYSVQHLDPSVEKPFTDDDTNADASSGILESSSQREYPNGQEFHLENKPMDYWKNIKVAVVDMMNDLSGFFHNLFGGHPAEKVTEHPDTATGFFEKVFGPSLMGLVIMVIMVVVLKRP